MNTVVIELFYLDDVVYMLVINDKYVPYIQNGIRSKIVFVLEVATQFQDK